MRRQQGPAGPAQRPQPPGRPPGTGLRAKPRPARQTLGPAGNLHSTSLAVGNWDLSPGGRSGEDRPIREVASGGGEPDVSGREGRRAAGVMGGGAGRDRGGIVEKTEDSDRAFRRIITKTEAVEQVACPRGWSRRRRKTPEQHASGDRAQRRPGSGGPALHCAGALGRSSLSPQSPQAQKTE